MNVGIFNLTHPIDNYTMLIFETYTKTGDDHKWRGKDFVLMSPYDYTKQLGGRYVVDTVNYTKEGKIFYYLLNLTLHEQSVEVEARLASSSDHKGIVIAKIYGIK